MALKQGQSRSLGHRKAHAAERVNAVCERTMTAVPA